MPRSIHALALWVLEWQARWTLDGHWSDDRTAGAFLFRRTGQLVFIPELVSEFHTKYIKGLKYWDKVDLCATFPV